MLSIRDLTKSFDGKPVLRHVRFEFPPGVTAVTGPSGSGKTTLFNILMGLMLPDAGEVDRPRDWRMATVFQEDRLIESWSAFKNIRLTCPKEVSDAEIARALAQVGLPERDDTRVNQYSGGMRRRVAIARAALHGADLLFLDEPFQGLDARSKERAVDFLQARMGEATVLLVSHDREDLEKMGAKKELSLG